MWKAAAAGATVMIFLALIVLKTTLWPSLKTTNKTVKSVKTAGTVSAQAFEAYTRGRELWARRNEDALKKAIKEFEHVLGMRAMPLNLLNLSIGYLYGGRIKDAKTVLERDQ